ncbi:MAG TPA: flagellin [Phycisphaerae bacterium]|nr:flagellin [Phycisphaerae bacterium]HNU46740.1 flagellin [Phycisphaerae bacterium]
MSTINTNIPSLVAQRHLSGSQRSLATSLERLASGLQINRGADNPAGLIVSERLRAEVAALNQAIDNSSRAINVIATAEGALDEVARLLIDIQALLIEAANTGAFSDEEMAANQLQIDSAIDSITRIANTTTFAGRKLLDGQMDYVTSGVQGATLGDVQVLGAKFGSSSSIPVMVQVTQSALKAELQYRLGSFTGSATSIDVAGINGIITLSFPASASSVDIVTAINNTSDATGVTAVASSDPTQGFKIQSSTYGTDAFVSVTERTPGSSLTFYDRNGGDVSRTVGVDAEGTINGARTIGDGLKLALSTAMLKMEVTLAQGEWASSTTFHITGGGALFQLGPQATINLQENIGIRSIQANRLGDAIVGYLSELKSGQANSLKTRNFKQASDIVEEVITQVAVLRGRLGAFERNTLQPNISQLMVTTENLTASESVIRDTDFAVETTSLTRNQILVQAGNSILAIANAQSQNVLTLLGG